MAALLLQTSSSWHVGSGGREHCLAVMGVWRWRRAHGSSSRCQRPTLRPSAEQRHACSERSRTRDPTEKHLAWAVVVDDSLVVLVVLPGFDTGANARAAHNVPMRRSTWQLDARALAEYDVLLLSMRHANSWRRKCTEFSAALAVSRIHARSFVARSEFCG